MSIPSGWSRTRAPAPSAAIPCSAISSAVSGFFGRPRERVLNSLGSGVIVESSGYIVTNNHVIKGGTDIRVSLSDRREFEAKVILADERTDLAILKIDPGKESLPFLQDG